MFANEIYGGSRSNKLNEGGILRIQNTNGEAIMTKPIIRTSGWLSPILSRFVFSVVLAFGFFVAVNTQAQTTNAYWDGDNDGQPGGSGSLNPTVARFSTNGPSLGGTLVGPNTNYVLHFGGTSGTVTQSGNTTNSGMNWLVSGYTYSVGANNNRQLIGFNNAALNITNNANLTIIGTNSSLSLRSMNLTGGTGSTLTLSANTGEALTIEFGSASTNSGRTNSVNTIINGAGTISLGTSGSSGFVQSGDITFNSTALLIFSNTASGNFTVSNTISGSGALSISNSSSGLFSLMGANTYSGGTTINQINSSAILAIYSSSPFGSGPITIAGAGTNYIRNYSNNIVITNAVVISNGSVLRIATTNTG